MTPASPTTTRTPDYGGTTAEPPAHKTPEPDLTPGPATPKDNEARNRSRSETRAGGSTARSQMHQQWIHSIISANPGIHVRRIAVITGLAWNTVRHHLRRLQQAQYVVEVKDQGRLCYFDRSRGKHANKDASVVLREPRNMTIARALVGREPRSQRELAAELDLAASVVSRRLERLEAAGLVQRIPQARCVLVSATDDLEDALATSDPWSHGPFGVILGHADLHAGAIGVGGAFGGMEGGDAE